MKSEQEPTAGYHTPNGVLRVNRSGGTRIVDDDGGPLVVYHGTQAHFSAFRRGRWPGTINDIGFWFSSDRNTASAFAGPRGHVMAAHLSIQNPLYVDTLDMLIELWTRHAGGTPRLREGDPDALRRWLAEQGHDGIVMSGRDLDGFAEGIYIVALKPDQIHLAEPDLSAEHLAPKPPTDMRIPPRVVYHGTNAVFDTFDTTCVSDKESEGGFFFSPDKERVRGYGDYVLTARIHLRNPFEFNVLTWLDGTGPSVSEMQRLGHDGIVIYGDPTSAGDPDWEFGNDVFIVFNPDQIEILGREAWPPEHPASGADGVSPHPSTEKSFSP